MKKFKFKVGQVVFKEDVEEYLLITGKHHDSDDGNMYDLNWQGDPNYDYAHESELRKLRKKEKGI